MRGSSTLLSLLMLPAVFAVSANSQVISSNYALPGKGPTEPCRGLLCQLTPNSMARPIGASDAADMQSAQTGVERPDKTNAPKKKKRTVSASRSRTIGRMAYLRIVAAKDVTSLAQLAGRPVSFGPNGDLAQAAGRRAFAALGIKVVETPLDLDNALDGAASGDIAAFVVFDSRDAAKLHSLRATDLHLLSIPAGREAPEGMKTAIVPPADVYALAHGSIVRTFAVEPNPPKSARRSGARLALR